MPAKQKPFGERLKAWRAAQKPPLSQAAAAAQLGVKLDTLQNWEIGRRSPNLATAEAVLVRLAKDGF